MPNPILVEVTRGGIVESQHAGAYAVMDDHGHSVIAAGDIARPVFPRSAIKAFQCLPVIESGAADRFGFIDEEIALACASHSGEPEHVRVARSMLAKTDAAESDYECGAHWPTDHEAQRALVRAGATPLAVHNNCSGKHAGMLALAKQLGAPALGYSRVEHPVQRAIAHVIGELCEADVDHAPCGIDGCSVPTWAVALRNLALGFARLTKRSSGQRIVAACRAHPFMVAGTGRFCTRLMQAVPRAFVKTGAEGVYCAAVPHAGLGIALKCDDGAGRAAEVATAAVLARLDIWTAEERAVLQGFAQVEIKNWRQFTTGEIRAVR